MSPPGAHLLSQKLEEELRILLSRLWKSVKQQQTYFATSTSSWCAIPRSILMFTTMQLKRPQTSPARGGDQHHPHWLIQSSLTLRTWAQRYQVRAVSELLWLIYCHARSHSPPLPCDHCQRDSPSQRALSRMDEWWVLHIFVIKIFAKLKTKPKTDGG